MMIDHNQCYRALKSRDPRFDGRFFTGVKTTGIYCRPICPARIPLRKNVEFFACAAAAEDAHYRACKRCRPDCAPGTPGWLGSSATVSQALQLIHGGALDQNSVEELAAECGVGGRHLSRLFQDQLGTSPGAIAQTRRVHFARQLIDRTSWPMTQVALAAGFASIRRFNSAILKSFAASPTELRRSAAAKAKQAHSRSPQLLRIAYRPPFDWAAILKFLGSRAIPGVEAVVGDRYLRSTRLAGDGEATLEIQHDKIQRQLLFSISELDPRDALIHVDRIRHLFDLAADPLEIAAALQTESKFTTLLQSGPRVPGCWDGFELAIRAIIGQQISVAGASTISGRLAEAYGEPLQQPIGPITRLFPLPEVLAEAKFSGMPKARAETIRRLSAAVADEKIVLAASHSFAENRARLCAIKGIGPWTAEYISMRVLRDPDAFPCSDLGLRKAMAVSGKLPSATQLAHMAEQWRPWRSYAAIMLWQSLSLEGNSSDPPSKS